MEKNNNNILVLLVAILSILVVALSAYIVYDKVFDTKDDNVLEKDTDKRQEKDNEGNSDKQEEINKEDSAYFDEYLKVFLPSGSANNFKKTINEFSDDDISNYLFFYYISLAKNNDIDPKLTDGIYTYNISKDEIDKVAYKYFGIKDYNAVVSTGRTGIRKLDNGEYQVYWFATGWMADSATNTLVKYDGNNVVVEYKLINSETEEETGNLTFNLVYNDGNYNVKSIVYDKLS